MSGNRCFRLLMLLAALSLPTGIIAADTDEPRFGMEIDCLDAGLRRLPDNTFLHGEKILVRVRLLDRVGLAAKEQYDSQSAAYGRAVAEGRAAESPDANWEKATPAVTLGTPEAPWTRQVEFFWGAGDKSNATQALTPAILPELLGPGTPSEQLFLFTEEFWELDSDQFPPGDISITARFQFSETDPGSGPIILEAGTQITLKPSTAVSNHEMARVRLHEAQAAVESGEYDVAIKLAKAAIEYGPESHFDLATLHIILGEAYQERDEYAAALDAYQEALRIAKEYFPGRSDLPIILRSKIDRVKDALGEEGQ